MIESGTTLKENVVADTAMLDNAVQVVEDDRVSQAGTDVLLDSTGLLVAGDLRPHKNCTPLTQIRRSLRLESQFGKLILNRDPQFLGLLLQKRAGPGGTDIVHSKVYHRPLLETGLGPPAMHLVHGR